MYKKIVKIALSCLLVGVATVGVYAAVLYKDASEVIDKIGTPEPVAEAQSAKVKPLTFLLMGIDHRENAGGLNSDVIMVVTVNPNDQSAALVSIPRDMELGPEGLPERKANYYYPYFYNLNKDTAFDNTKQLFGDLLDVPIDYAATIDFDGFRQTVDILGGLTINVDMDMRYVDDEDGTNINLKKGIAKLDGKQVLDFVRYRKSNRDTQESSDFERNQRQQQVMGEMLGALKSAGGISKLSQIIETLGNHLRTDVPAVQIRDLISTYFHMDPSKISYMNLEGEWVSPYVIVKDEDIEKASMLLKQQLGETVPSFTDRGAKDDSVTGSTYGGGRGNGSVSGSKPAAGSGSGKSTVSRSTYGTTSASDFANPYRTITQNPLPFD
ncbi:Putative transcriptional regulator YvhJ [Paenibacillus konkukensis]|uniref:Transcriptional regulator YvhJ n=1 Tax=Paenibacillus konkukensis TaxID=2020716 RepID=A0ABY4RMV5_9BACL|nr:LCP family protein [Paenibacillus konkukensis]UQZ83751.1 Putative transcriptional regulator YvhJ [Paenibacillus konkukensis]